MSIHKVFIVGLIAVWVACGVLITDNNLKPQLVEVEKEKGVKIIYAEVKADKPVTTKEKVKEIPAILTAYTPVECNNPSRGRTASGTIAQERHTVAMDKRFPFGTLVEINGIIYEVEDRGGFVSGNTIDIYMNSYAEAIQFGRRSATVKIIKIGSGKANGSL